MEIVAYQPEFRQELLELSLRAWHAVFMKLQAEVPRFVYQCFYPHGWERRQRDDIAQVLDNESELIDVAVVNGKAVGWVCTRIHDEDKMGEMYVLAVDPEHRGQGIAKALMQRTYQRSKNAGMRMVMVETGDDSGHEPARMLYESDGFVRWPVARYFKELR